MTNHDINSTPAPYPYLPLAPEVPCGICGDPSPAPASIEVDPICLRCRMEQPAPTVAELMTMMGLD